MSPLCSKCGSREYGIRRDDIIHNGMEWNWVDNNKYGRMLSYCSLWGTPGRSWIHLNILSPLNEDWYPEQNRDWACNHPSHRHDLIIRIQVWGKGQLWVIAQHLSTDPEPEQDMKTKRCVHCFVYLQFTIIHWWAIPWLLVYIFVTSDSSKDPVFQDLKRDRWQ